VHKWECPDQNKLCSIGFHMFVPCFDMDILKYSMISMRVRCLLRKKKNVSFHFRNRKMSIPIVKMLCTRLRLCVIKSAFWAANVKRARAIQESSLCLDTNKAHLSFSISLCITKNSRNVNWVYHYSLVIYSDRLFSISISKPKHCHSSFLHTHKHITSFMFSSHCWSLSFSWLLGRK
jgi:hypothetical protein